MSMSRVSAPVLDRSRIMSTYSAVGNIKVAILSPSHFPVNASHNEAQLYAWYVRPVQGGTVAQQIQKNTGKQVLESIEYVERTNWVCAFEQLGFEGALEPVISLQGPQHGL